LIGYANKKCRQRLSFNSHLSVNHLFDFILNDFGIPIDFRPKSNMLLQLNTWLIHRFRAGETPVLIAMPDGLYKPCTSSTGSEQVGT
jgi:general secretion pathway protein A